MRRKRPFFLLEIVIAIFLVGLFSIYFLRSSIHCLYRERTALLDLEFEREFDLKRMKLLSSNWGIAEHLPLSGSAGGISEPSTVYFGGKPYTRTKNFKIYRSKKELKEYCGLILQEDKKKYYFLVKKSEV